MLAGAERSAGGVVELRPAGIGLEADARGVDLVEVRVGAVEAVLAPEQRVAEREQTLGGPAGQVSDGHGRDDRRHGRLSSNVYLS